MTTLPVYARRTVSFTTIGTGSNPSPDVGIDTISDGDSATRNLNPNWRQDIARHRDASRPYFHSHLTWRPGSFYGESSVVQTRWTVRPPDPTISVGGGQTGFGGFQPFTSYVYGSRTDAASSAIAVARVRQKLSSHTKSMNVVVPAVELREFRGLIRSSAELTSTLFETLIDIKKRGGRKALKYAADAWLTFQFGVKPMVSDTAKASEAIAEFLSATDHSVVLSSSAPPVRRLVSGTRGPYTAPFGLTRYNVLQGISELNYRCVAGFHVPVKAANDYGLSSQFGISFSALPSVAWELIPYSWAVDYFTNVGQYLDDVFSTPSGTCNYCVVDRKFTCDFSITADMRKARPDVIWNIFSRPGRGSYFEFERTTSSLLPTPALRFRSLDEIGRNWVFKALNLGAILAQRR